MPKMSVKRMCRPAGGAGGRPCASVEAGLEAAPAETGRDGVICALGSLYLCGEVRSAWFKRR